ncbi:hypothetical protein [Nostoc sp. DedQUE03]|uniref:hypothetical protein n=1 Tax=Nostoc sp. DedQUE03 TaxID=3075389 RepID=UPI00391B0341
MDPRWTHANKDGVETAYSTFSNIWFTIWKIIRNSQSTLPFSGLKAASGKGAIIRLQFRD